MKLPVKTLPSGEGLPLPLYATIGAAGADLSAAIVSPQMLAPGERALIPTGLAMALPEGWEAQIRPRSGLALKHGVTVLNAPGTIDADYRGEVGVLLINHGDEPFTIQRGDRIAQIVFAEVTQVDFVEADLTAAATRSSAGFGSTGGIG